MLPLFDGTTSVSSAIQELLDVVDSSRASPSERLKAVSRLEEQFGHVVLNSDKEPTSSSLAARSAWWHAQSRPQSCVALSLVGLVHRLHIQCKLGYAGDGSDEKALTCSLLISCFTILQGLCLKDSESRRICSRKSTLELVLDVVGAVYWDSEMQQSNVPAHAIDLLICVTISSPSASRLVESLQGEEVVRSLMDAHTFGGDAVGGSGRRAVTLDQVQDSPLVIKCAEFLLFFEYGREETIEGDETGLISDSFRTAVSQSFSHHRRSVESSRRWEERPRRESTHQRARSSSPTKAQRREERVRRTVMHSNQIGGGGGGGVRLERETSPTKKRTHVDQGPVKTSLTPFARSAITAVSHRPGVRGRSRERNALSAMQDAASSASDSPLSSAHSSPLKSIIGPSPAVQRAQARSVSPVKRRPLPSKRIPG